MKFLKFVASAVALCAVFGAQARTFDEVKMKRAAIFDTAALR